MNTICVRLTPTLITGHKQPYLHSDVTYFGYKILLLYSLIIHFLTLGVGVIEQETSYFWENFILHKVSCSITEFTTL